MATMLPTGMLLPGNRNSAVDNDSRWFAKHRRRNIRVRALLPGDTCSGSHDRPAMVVFQLQPGRRLRMPVELPEWAEVSDFKAEDMAACLLYANVSKRMQDDARERSLPELLGAIGALVQARKLISLREAAALSDRRKALRESATAAREDRGQTEPPSIQSETTP